MIRLIALLMAITYLNASFAKSSNELSVGWNLWYPYQFYNAQNNLVGLDVDIAKLVAREAGFELTFTELPWKRHLQFIRTGIVDIALGASPTEQRKAYAEFTIPYRQEQIALFVRKGTHKVMPFSQLADIIGSRFMIGVEDGYYYGEEFESLSLSDDFNAHIGRSLNLEQNMSLLMKGKIDGVLADDIAMQAFVKKYQLIDDIEQHPIKIHRSDIRFMMSKKSVKADIVNRFNDAIKKLKSNGKIEQLMQHWTNQQGQDLKLKTVKP